MTKAFNILIVEDELIIAEMISEMLLELNYKVVGVAKNYSEAMQFLSGVEKIDLAILDINLEEEKTGIDLGEELGKTELPFIYLTSYSDPKTIYNAAVTQPAAYLLKPFTESDLFTTIEIIKARNYQNDTTVLVKDGHANVKIQSTDIIYIKSDNNYIEVVTESKKYLLRNSLEGFLAELNDSNFIRIHRSYAVNMTKIDAVNGQYVLIGSEKYPIARTQKEEVLKQFSK